MSGKKSTDGIRVVQDDISKKIYIQSTFSPYYFGRTDYMIKLNHKGSGETEQIKLYFLSPGTYQFDQLYLVEVDKEETIEKIQNLQRNALENITYSGNHFSGEIKTDQDKMVCVAIPYSSGWKASVDGRETEIYQANGMYMGIPVSAGDHKIELTYTTPGLKIGLVISAAGWAVFVVLIIVMQRRKRIKTENNE